MAKGKKKTAKKAAPKKAAKVAKVSKAAAKAPKATAVSSRWGKSQILNELSARVAVTRKQAAGVVDELSSIIHRHIGKAGPGEFVLPGLFKISTKKKPAVKAGMRRNPFTGQMVMGKAKPASVQVKVRPLQKLKGMAG
jgi:nucleoid DNA-binding protein